jgi:hypothetical protein
VYHACCVLCGADLMCFLLYIVFCLDQVRGALSTLAKGYVTNKGNSVILTGRTKPVLIGSAVDDEQDDGQPRSS